MAAETLIRKSTSRYNIVAFKKFKGLEYLINTYYDYIIVCDAEMDIIPQNFNQENIMNKINIIFENKIVYAGNVINQDFITIMTPSRNAFIKEIDRKKINEILQNGELYHWWSDLPVVKRDHIQPFFESIGYEETVEDWKLHFESSTYVNYLILYHDFKVINTTPITNRCFSLEWLITNDKTILDGLVEIKFGFSWILAQLYHIHSEYLNKKGTFIIYHTNRHGC